jgi:hypothetical protein
MGNSHSINQILISENHNWWSDLFRANLPVLRRMHREGGDCVVCESPRGHPIAIPFG